MRDYHLETWNEIYVGLRSFFIGFVFFMATLFPLGMAVYYYYNW